MGQSLSSNHPTPPGRLVSSHQNSHRQSLKRVHSEETENGKRSISVSLPASPSIRRRAVSADPQQHEQQQLESPSKVPLSFESMLKNFEEFAQHQWPTWAKRRGWIADETPPSSAATTDDGSGRVVQVDKDKWIFLRHRKKCTPSISPVSPASIPVETVVEEDVLPDLNKAVEKMVDILQIDESRIVTSSGGQRSRRSSGYASASSSPSAVKRTATEHVSAAAAAVLTTSTSGSHLTVPEDNEDWRISGLYEVTLRWMFDAGSFVEEEQPTSFDDKIAVLDDSGTCNSLIEEETNQHRPTAAAAAEDSITVAPVETIRIYLHFFCRQKNKLPSFIDFRPIPLLSTDDAGPSPRQTYALVFQDGSPAPQTSFPMEIACIELVRIIVESHPQLLDWLEPRKLAIYEKSWQPGKTSRARLRRLNDFDCPLLLAQHWQTSGASNLDASNCAKTLILQESQNGDIPWEEFTVAELSSFLKVLDREEKNHEMQIRERYQLLNERLRETMQLSNPSACNST